MATIIVHAFIPYYEATGDWEAMAWWVHDHLPYSEMQFFPKIRRLQHRLARSAEAAHHEL